MIPNHGEATGIGFILIGLGYVLAALLLAVVLVVVGAMLVAFTLVEAVRWAVSAVAGRPAPDVRGDFATIFDIARNR